MTDVYSNIQNGKYNVTVPYLNNRDAYNAESRRVDDEFYVDCCEDLGLDPRAASSEKLFQKAYEDGHAHGHTEVYNHLVDLDAFVNEWAELKRSEG